MSKEEEISESGNILCYQSHSCVRLLVLVIEVKQEKIDCEE